MTSPLPLDGFVAFIDRAQIQPEETALLEKFGAEYAAYQAATPQWIERRTIRSTSQ